MPRKVRWPSARSANRGSAAADRPVNPVGQRGFMNALPSRISVERIIKPNSVAIIGASEDEAKFGGRIMHNVVRHGYAGALLPINPNRETILGRRAYPDIGAAPGPVDLAVIAVPA